MEDHIWWKTTFDGRQAFMEDYLWWKTTFDGRWPLMKDHLWWKMTFDVRWSLMEDNLWCKMTYDGRWAFTGDEFYIFSDLKIKITGKMTTTSKMKKASVWLRLGLFAVNLSGTSVFKDNAWNGLTYMPQMTFDGGRPLMEDNLRWKTTFNGRQPSMEDNLWWKTTFDGRWPLIEDDLQ